MSHDTPIYYFTIYISQNLIIPVPVDTQKEFDIHLWDWCESLTSLIMQYSLGT